MPSPGRPTTSITILIFLVTGAGAVDAQSGVYPTANEGGNYMHNYYFPPAPSSTPWWPAWSPDGSRIAVAMAGSIWAVDPTSGIAEELTSGPTYHSSPTWSPDGRWLVYTADDDGRTIQLEVLDLETNESVPLTDGEFIYVDPSFSPDGTRIAYVSTAPNGHFNVYVRAFRDGRWAGDPVAVTTDNDFGRSRLYFGSWDMHIAPAWFPDGRELLLVSNRDQALGSGHVWRVPATANGIDAAQVVLREQTLYRTRPDVSIDGRRFVYSSTAGAADQFNNLYVQPTGGGEPYKLTFFEHDAFHPRWSPDGNWIAYITNAEGLPQLALLETYGGAQRTVPITERRWRRPVGRLTVQVIDATTDRATPARVHLVAADGKSYAPVNAYARVGFAQDHLFHTAGRFDVDVPAGPVRLTVTKGFEFQPVTTEIDVNADQSAQTVVRLERRTDMGDRGWYSGSTHVHMNYGGNLHNSLENLMLMSAAEDQDIVNEQIANKDNRILDYQYFVPGGGPHPRSTPDRLLVVGQEYRPPFYGHVFLLGLRDHLISPYVTGYEGTAIESLYPSNTDMLRKAKDQGATTGYVHAFFGENDPLTADLGGGKGFIVDAALGTTDAVEWSTASHAGFFPLYAVWNNGLRVTAAGGEDSISDLHRSKIVGSIRTYVCTANGELSMTGWFDGLRSGHAFVTDGPLVEMTVDGRIPGQEVRLPAPGTVRVRAHVTSIAPLDRLRVIHNGQVVDEIEAGPNRYELGYDAQYTVRESGWFHVTVEGAPEDRYPLDVDYAQAFTNPVWISVASRPVRHRPSAEYALRWIERLEMMAREWPGWRSPDETAHVLAQFDQARGVYRRFLTEARVGAEPAAERTGPRGAVTAWPPPGRSCRAGAN